MNILKANQKYEDWLRTQMPLVESDLTYKHEQMASTTFSFFRATYFRWAQTWAKKCDKAGGGPSILTVGDLHIENFGTWRDLEGRLVWGLNDFDEAASLPYTNDLIRLAASAALAIREERLLFDLQDACEAITDGYAKGLETGGCPFVLEEHHPELRRMATSSLRTPDHFWSKMKSLDAASGPEMAEAIAAIGKSLPQGCASESPRVRRAGLGSLGRPRYVVLAEVEGGMIAREAKRMTGSAAYWAKKEKEPHPIQYENLLRSSVRCQDPHVALLGKWLVRRLAPHCTRIPLEDWSKEHQEIVLVHAMGLETANVHLATPKAVQEIQEDLKGRSKKWLRKTAEALADSVEEDAEAWREAFKQGNIGA